MIFLSKRKLCFKALVGSHNYNLNNEFSDKDYKIFFYPDFDDLYEGGQYSKAFVSDDEDIEYHDIRKLPNLLYKSNVNFMEVLFSEEYEVYDQELYSKIIVLRDELAKMNLPYLYDACLGMYMQKMKEFNRDKGKELPGKTYKHVMSSYRILDFLDRYQKFSFSSFKQAMQYDAKDPVRELLLNIRLGEYSFDQLEEMISKKEQVIRSFEDVYKSAKVNVTLKEKFEQLIKVSVKTVLIESFNGG
ncbi:DNA polymerase beta superfamily protein [Schinkia azotoformans]|uniref:DNA polymerase beta superfamily protein n=1 Tax=Schinkia azotoformans TaxID=1454 RepID=UPI001E4E0858|nr:nucleotidyltransferase domain-containing protein [Schinkia azotoformans]MEC1697856.1 nucleotidyltransferase domain-containing protein [Schinkia azotoformans]MEC1726270.1 nucleotidyltransferase domain-containing protein [Schinkia azotoformans]MEC1780172.1 nucleotidyltransferase domain-containing protein [Schinkia azotoformans]